MRPVLLVALLVAAAPAALAGGPEESASPEGSCAEAVAARVQAHYEDVRDLKADFTQKTRSVALGGAPAGAEMEASGSVVFAKPGRMRWEYTEPEPSLVVSDGETLWIYDPAAQEVQVLPVGAGLLSAAALQFLLGEGEILESFAVEARGCAEPRVGLLLTPREPAGYERLEMRVDAATGQVASTTVIDLFGNRTEVGFTRMRTNAGPADDLFRFEPPEGVRVLELPAEP